MESGPGNSWVDAVASFPPKCNAPKDIPARAATPSDSFTRKLRREGSPLGVWDDFAANLTPFDLDMEY